MRDVTVFSLSAFCVGALLTLASPVRFSAQEKATERPKFSGEWMLNRDLSASPRPFEEGRRTGDGQRGRGGQGGGGRGGFGGFGGGGGGGRGGFGGGAGPSAERERAREEMQEARRLFADAPTSMVITYADPKLVITATDGRVRTLYTDKRKQKTSNGDADVQTHWDNDRLVAETKFGSITVIETYALAADGDALVVTAKMDAPNRNRGGDRPNFELRRVYERVEREEQPSALAR